VPDAPAMAKANSHNQFDARQQAFLDFVLAHCVTQGVDELDNDKLTPLLRLKYNNAISDAVVDLGGTTQIRKMFAGFYCARLQSWTMPGSDRLFSKMCHQACHRKLK
jgi:hypothetical protein